MFTSEGRFVGEVINVRDGFGFIRSEAAPDHAYFKQEWLRGSREPLQVGERVSFELRRYGPRVQAHYVRRVQQDVESVRGDGNDAGSIAGEDERGTDRDIESGRRPERGSWYRHEFRMGSGLGSRFGSGTGRAEADPGPGSAADGGLDRSAEIGSNAGATPRAGAGSVSGARSFGSDPAAGSVSGARSFGPDPAAGSEIASSPARRLGPPSMDFLLDWAYMGYMPETLTALKGLALEEEWDFGRHDPERPYPILHNYLLQTFGRLVEENKVWVNAEAGMAAFNTGLVDRRYEDIFAVFTPNDDARAPWKLAEFCIRGEGPGGQALVRAFKQAPPRAHYFDDVSAVVYDARKGAPTGIDWRHIIIERLDRYPVAFLERHWPASAPWRDLRKLHEEARVEAVAELARAVETDGPTYRAMMRDIRGAIDMAVKRAERNYKTTVVQYYPREKKLQLLLPLSLVSDDEVDLALVVEDVGRDNYQAHTVLPLEWAYMNARLVISPESDWLRSRQTGREDADGARGGNGVFPAA